MEIITAIDALQALYLNGYRYKECRVMTKFGDTARVYSNDRGIEIFMWRDGQDQIKRKR